MPRLKNKSSKIEAGFTLIELMVAIIVLGLVIASMGMLYYTSEAVAAKTAHYDVAIRDARTEIEELRNTGYDSLTSGSSFNFTIPPGLPSNATGTVAVCIPNNATNCPSGLKRVDVTISYTEYGSTQTVTLSSDIGILGIDQ